MAEEVKKKKGRGRYSTGLVILFILAAVTVASFVFHEQLLADNSWCMTHDTGNTLLNSLLRLVPRVIRSIQVLFVTLLVIYVACAIIAKVFRGTSRRITIGKLVNSILKVVVWVVAVIVILAVWGVDVTALIAGAGVLTLVIGLGMQSLIADVIAGIFIVCDGTLQVGDIVTIDGWRGTVQEIGIRNTKLINYSGDIRIANNSTIKVFINQSREISYPTTTISITYEEDIRRVEKLFEEHREELKAQLPLVIEGPDYKGVKELAASSVDLLFGATCKEDDFFQVQRDMNRVLRIFFMENNIAIPFPQLDIHTPDAVQAPKEKKAVSKPQKAASKPQKAVTTQNKAKKCRLSDDIFARRASRGGRAVIFTKISDKFLFFS